MKDIFKKTFETLLQKIDHDHNKNNNVLYGSNFVLPINELRTISKSIIHTQSNSTISNKNIYRDLEVFNTFGQNCTNTENEKDHHVQVSESESASESASLFEIIDKTSCITGKTYLRKILENPLSNIDELYNRQKILQLFLNSSTLQHDIIDNLNKIRENEDGVLWFWKKIDKDTQNIFNSVYFSDFLTRILNKSEYALSIMHHLKTIVNPAFGLLSPIVFLILPYFIITKVTRYSIDFSEFFKIMKLTFNMDTVLGFNNDSYYYKLFHYGSKFVWLLLYIQGIVSNFYYAYMLNNITSILFEKIRKVSQYVIHAKNIITLIDKICIDMTNDNIDISVYDDIKPSDDIKKILESNICERLYDTLYSHEHTFYCNKGKFLKIFLELRDHYEFLTPVVVYISKIDSYISIVKLYNELRNNKKYVCFPEFKVSSVPIIITKKNWFIKLKDNSTIVTNSYKIGNPLRNCVITGPNAGGKSTHIKTVIFSVLLSQTFGIVPAKKFIVTPFHKINTYLNIPDNTGKESLFQAEMARCRDYIDNLETLSPNQFSIIIMDEIFSSTNPEDGIAAGFSILEYLAKKKNNMCLITTHYKYLTNLHGFKNYKFPVKIHSNGSFTYQYKLKKGINDQYIAIELLKEYMNRDIYRSAIDIRKSIV